MTKERNINIDYDDDPETSAAIKEDEQGSDQTTEVRRLNDDVRRHGRGGRVVLTRGVAALGPMVITVIMGAIRTFNGFTPGNDPYGEHDCAMVEVAGQSILWKIDYFDTALAGHSPDPADPEVTCRVLTVMLADEY